MNRNIFAAAGLTLAAVLFALPAQALSLRTFVSGHGSDGNNCSFATPCRSFATAFANTVAGGEIYVLDTSGYGTLTIDKAISIVNDGVGTSSVLVPSGGIGITINAGVNDVINLRGLNIEGGGSGATGIKFNTGASLTVTNSAIRHVTQNGIDFLPNATTKLSVSNSLVADNGANGINVVPTGSGTVTAVFNRVEVSNNPNIGIYVAGDLSSGKVNATVAESVAAHNGAALVTTSGSGHAVTTLTVFHSVSANNGAGISSVGTGAILRLAQSEVTGNSPNGWFTQSGGVIDSYGDNYIDGNGANVGSLTSIAKQ